MWGKHTTSVLRAAQCGRSALTFGLKFMALSIG